MTWDVLIDYIHWADACYAAGQDEPRDYTAYDLVVA